MIYNLLPLISFTIISVLEHYTSWEVNFTSNCSEVGDTICNKVMKALYVTSLSFRPAMALIIYAKDCISLLCEPCTSA